MRRKDNKWLFILIKMDPVNRTPKKRGETHLQGFLMPYNRYIEVKVYEY